MSTHSCNELCNMADGWGHIAQKQLCDDFSDEDMAEQLRKELPKRIERDSSLLDALIKD